MSKNLILSICLIFIGIVGKAQMPDTLFVYPNPFQDTATIEFHINQIDTVSLNVYSLTGVNVRPYFQDSIFPAGNYSLALIGDGLPEGLYLIKLEINAATLTKKIVKNSGATVLSENGFDEKDLFLFPNPSSNELTIQLNNKPTTKNIIIIKDITGNTVLQTKLNADKTLDVSHLSNGLYFVQMQTDKGMQTAKFIKQ